MDLNALILRDAKAKWRRQKQNAGKRGIEWCLSFDDWWKFWQESGLYYLRGRHGYCMGRKSDTGPYALDNIYVCTIGENFADAWKFKKWEKRQGRKPGKGWSENKGRYYARYRGRSLGAFSTPEEAHAAYRSAIDAEVLGQVNCA